MKIRNDSRYPTALLRTLLYYAEGDVNTTGVGVHIIDADHTYSGAYHTWKPRHSVFRGVKSVRYHITLRIGAPTRFPARDHHGRKFKTAAKKGYVLTDGYQDWKEGFLGVAAHEIWHHYQNKNRRKFREVDAIRYAYQRVMAYRANEANTKREQKLLALAKPRKEE